MTTSRIIPGDIIVSDDNVDYYINLYRDPTSTEGFPNPVVGRLEPGYPGIVVAINDQHPDRRVAFVVCSIGIGWQSCYFLERIAA